MAGGNGPSEGGVDDDGEVGCTVEPRRPPRGITGPVPLERQTGQLEGSVNELPDRMELARTEHVVPVVGAAVLLRCPAEDVGANLDLPADPSDATDERRECR
jgi:hypothetical protein